MSDKHVIVATFTLPMEAQVACGRLRAEGIVAVLSNDVASSAFPGIVGLAGRVELYVPLSDLERAELILEECLQEQQGHTGTEQRSEKEGPLWVCSLCGDAVSVDETTCVACGTSREALRPANSEELHEKQPARRTTREDVRPDEPQPTRLGRPALETDFELPALDNLHQGDALAGKAMKAALLSLMIPLIGFVSVVLLVQLLFYEGELSPVGLRKMVVALAVNLLWFFGSLAVVFYYGFHFLL